jgi:hypothetical protein
MIKKYHRKLKNNKMWRMGKRAYKKTKENCVNFVNRG